MFYSASTGGFYDPAVHGDNIPADAVSVAPSAHHALMEGQAQGKAIVAGANGKPVLADRPAPSPEQVLASREAARAAAYRDEADPLFFKAQRGEATMAEWEAKVADIRARYPYPGE